MNWLRRMFRLKPPRIERVVLHPLVLLSLFNVDLAPGNRVLPGIARMVIVGGDFVWDLDEL